MTVPTNFKSAITSKQVSTMRWMEIEGLAIAYGTVSQPGSFFNSRSTIQKFDSIKPWMAGIPKGIGQSVDTLNGGALTSGQIEFEIIDMDGSISALHGLGNLTGSVKLTSDLSAGAVTIFYTGSASSFAAGGLMYIGTETIKIGAIDTVNKKFTGCTRGMYRSTPTAFGLGTPIGVRPYVMACRRVWYNQVALAGDGTSVANGQNLSAFLTSIEPDKCIRFSGLLVDTRLNDPRSGYILTANSVDTEINKNILTTLRSFVVGQAFNDGTPTASVALTAPGWKNYDPIHNWFSLDNSLSQFTLNEIVAFRLDDEIIIGTVKNDTTNPNWTIWIMQVTARAQFSTQPASHDAGAVAQEICGVVEFNSAPGYPNSASASKFSAVTPAGVRKDHPLVILLSFLCSTGLGTNGHYDVLPLGWGLSIDQARIDIAGIEAVMLEDSMLRFGGVMSTTTNFQDFMRNMLATMGYYYIVTLGDHLVIKKLRPNKPDVTSRQMDDSTGRVRGFGTKWEGNWSGAVSEIVFNFGWDIVHNKFKRISVFRLGEATIYVKDLARTLEFQCPLLYPGSTGIPGEPDFKPFDVDTWLLQRKDFYRTRYARPPPILRERTDISFLDVEIGDLVSVTAANVPDVATGLVGVTTVTCEVIGKTIDDKAGCIDWVLLNTGWLTGFYRFISPSFWADNSSNDIGGGSADFSSTQAWFTDGQAGDSDVVGVATDGTSFNYWQIGFKVLVWADDFSHAQLGTITGFNGGDPLDPIVHADSGTWDGATGIGNNNYLTYPDYGNATVAQRALYAFQADTNDQLVASVPSPAHRWFPT